jgi:hypothetical protein
MKNMTLNEARKLSPDTICQCVDVLNFLAAHFSDGYLDEHGNLRSMTTRALAKVATETAAKAKPVVFQRAAE